MGAFAVISGKTVNRVGKGLSELQGMVNRRWIRKMIKWNIMQSNKIAIIQTSKRNRRVQEQSSIDLKSRRRRAGLRESRLVPRSSPAQRPTFPAQKLPP